MALVDPVIVVPGITASYLHDEYTLPPENLWTVMTKAYERVAMHPDNLDYESVEPAVVRPGQIFEVAYQEMIEELRYNLSPAADEPVSVYPFGYDWRHPLDRIEAALADFVDEVIERTKLLPHYYENGYHENPRVNLIGHSMGGLIITGYLESAGRKAKVNKVATLATPYRGSYEAVIKVITGTADLGTKAPSSRERESARLTPALYHLLPSFDKAVVTASGLPNSLYSPGVWQPTVAESIAEFIRLHGLPKADRRTKTARREDGERLLARMLRMAKKHRARTEKFTLAKAGLTRSDWLAVVGVGSKTRTTLEVVNGSGGPQFKFRSADRRDEWANADAAEARLTGDGTVPFEGALPTFLDESDIVCVTPDDFGYWELQDKALAGLAGLHGILPNMNMLHRMLVRFFTGSSDRRGNTWGHSVPGISKRQWTPPLRLDHKAREIDDGSDDTPDIRPTRDR